MGMKLKLIPFLFRTHFADSAQSWPWASCSTQPKTLSFRIASAQTENPPETESPGGDEVEAAVLRGLRARDRLFFEPEETSSILNPPPPAKENESEEDPAAADDALFKGSLVTAMDSLEPLMDFRKSMEEMVEAHGLMDWAGLQELLGLYLHVNERCNHGYIVSAFADLLIGICFSPPPSSSTPTTTSSMSLPGEGDDNLHMGSSDLSTSMSHSPTSALSFSSSSRSSIVHTSLPMLEPDDDDHHHHIQLTASSSSSSSSSTSTSVI